MLGCMPRRQPRLTTTLRCGCGKRLGHIGIGDRPHVKGESITALFFVDVFTKIVGDAPLAIPRITKTNDGRRHMLGGLTRLSDVNYEINCPRCRQVWRGRNSDLDALVRQAQALGSSTATLPVP